MPSTGHIPVMLEETMKALAVQPGGRYIDCTLGGGGHAEAILHRSAPGGQLLGIDADSKAISAASKRLSAYRDSLLLVNDNFANLQSICIRYDFSPVHGILFDLGLSSLQLETGRGFSFQRDAALDMRFDPGQETTAADIVNNYSEMALSELIRTYGEESYSRRIARAIVNERPIHGTSHLANLVERAVGGRKGSRIHPATKTFQALRIAVNQELEHLKMALRQAVESLGFGGRLVVISYHSLEDRIVKQFMRQEAQGCICPPNAPGCTCGHVPQLKLVSRKIIVPDEEEVKTNPRSRSARLRAAERITVPQDFFKTAGNADSFDCLVTAGSRGWRRPALVKKIRMVFALS